jgi:hypothetical protein
LAVVPVRFADMMRPVRCDELGQDFYIFVVDVFDIILLKVALFVHKFILN